MEIKTVITSEDGKQHDITATLNDDQVRFLLEFAFLELLRAGVIKYGEGIESELYNVDKGNLN